jgi:hypothetical protein
MSLIVRVASVLASSHCALGGIVSLQREDNQQPHAAPSQISLFSQLCIPVFPGAARAVVNPRRALMQGYNRP